MRLCACVVADADKLVNTLALWYNRKPWGYCPLPSDIHFAAFFGYLFFPQPKLSTLPPSFTGQGQSDESSDLRDGGTFKSYLYSLSSMAVQAVCTCLWMNLSGSFGRVGLPWFTKQRLHSIIRGLTKPAPSCSLYSTIPMFGDTQTTQAAILLANSPSLTPLTHERSWSCAGVT